MGCQPSKSVAPAYDAEKKRPNTPGRIEIPAAHGAWVCGTINTALAVENAFRVRVDNATGAPLRNVILRRPHDLGSFNNFTEDEMGYDGDGDEFDDFMKRLPTTAYTPIDIIELGGGETKKQVRGRVASMPAYEGGERVLVLHSSAPGRPSRLVDARVVGPAINAGGGALYKLLVEPGPAGGGGGGGSSSSSSSSSKPKEVITDLNDFNHCVQRFDSAAAYEAARIAHLNDVVEKLGVIEDAITGNKLNLDDQEAVYISLDHGNTGGRKSTTEHGSPWSRLASMEDLARLMILPSPDRSQGTHEVMGVLLRAGPGTGKTVSLQQLTRLLALELLAEGKAKKDDEGASGGVGLVPIFVSVQRLATYLNKPQTYMLDDEGETSTKQKPDLLRSFIVCTYEGARRDMLLQAYEMRALVCCIDGVDEAAGMKGKIEDLVIQKLVPLGTRTVVSSRPEGVRLERYTNFVVMNLSPLTYEQQRQMILLQLKGKDALQTYDHVAALSTLRKGDKDALDKGLGGEHSSVLLSLLGAGADNSRLSRVLDFFDEASHVPVMLSMLLVCLQSTAETGGVVLPADSLELYESAARVSVQRRLSQMDDTKHVLSSVVDMLTSVAVANHLAQRREFTSIEVYEALAQRPSALVAWRELEGGEGGVPLIKTLEVGSFDVDSAAKAVAGGDRVSQAKQQENATKYQFKHLFFQEAFFAQALTAAEQQGPPSASSSSLSGGGDLTRVSDDLVASAQAIWAPGAFKALNTRWLLNTFTICGRYLSKSVCHHLPSHLTVLNLTEQQVKAFVGLRWEPLRELKGLTHIVLRCGHVVSSADGGEDEDEADGGGRTSSSSAVSEVPAAGFSPLAAILADTNELPKLTAMEFGTPASINRQDAITLCKAAEGRRHLKMCTAIHPAQVGGLADADAVLIASTLRASNSTTCSMDVEGLFDELKISRSSSPSSASAGGVSIVAGATTLAAAFAAASSSVQASTFPKELSSLLPLCGYGTAELRAAKFSTAELTALGYSAAAIASTASGSSGGKPWPSNVLKEMYEHDLAVELTAQCSTSEDERAGMVGAWRDAGCTGVPTHEEIEEAVHKAGLGQVTNLRGMTRIDADKRDLDDADCNGLVWAITIYATDKLAELSLAKNKLGLSSASAIGMLLRCSRTCKTVDLHENQLGDSSAPVLAKALAFNESVATLRISHNKFTTGGMRELCSSGLVKNLNLRSLVLEQSGGTVSSGLYLPPLKGVEPAYSLDLGALRFGPLSSEVMGQMITTYRPDLTSLRLDHNPLSKDGMASISEMIKVNEDIRELHLRFCALGANGTALLASALKVNKSIEEVYMLGNQIGDEGAEALIGALPQITSLRRLEAQDNLISPQKKAALQEAAQKTEGLVLYL